MLTSRQRSFFFAESTAGLRRRDVVIAYTLLRIILGINFFNHGFTRIGNIPAFVNSMAEMFQDTFLPLFLVRFTSFFVPIIELIVGFLVIFGLATQVALITGFALMAILMYGVTLLQNWDTATSQLVYCLVFFILVAGNGFNILSVDWFIQRRKPRF
ncbi:DoxX family protein [Gloeothece citriformis PCC 7424]|uniref:DoxX family protein n=1 Tax=Gloeothece citriformis (strain PCC 7424) TaxID=65393 RepID=B7KIX1_GLOC7|nr:DoxX family protein [Gloeothece citriformis]ACK70807.1 DoxX family protein [Gloeothece citriformis PCC 7424]